MVVESLFVVVPVVWCMGILCFFCHIDLIVLSSFSIILLKKKQQIALHFMCSWCLE